MLNTVRNYLPDTWNGSDETCELSLYSEEYRKIANHLKERSPSKNITSILRVQNLYAFGQFLVREQLLIKAQSTSLYRVRRYVQVDCNYLQQVVRYNLDPRRCGLGKSLTFYKELDSFDTNKMIVVVKVLVTNPDTNAVNIKSSSDYYVEYIVS